MRKLKQNGHESEDIFNIILSHHENFDGSGYPEKLKGEDIPMGARVVAVADAYSALTSWRPYRGQWDCQAAFTEIKEDAEKDKFDPQVINALRSFLNFSHEVYNEECGENMNN